MNKTTVIAVALMVVGAAYMFMNQGVQVNISPAPTATAQAVSPFTTAARQSDGSILFTRQDGETLSVDSYGLATGSVSPWSLTDNTDPFPDAKIPAAVARSANIGLLLSGNQIALVTDGSGGSHVTIPPTNLDGVYPWARVHNFDQIPASKVPFAAEVAIWARETDTTLIPLSKIPNTVARTEGVTTAVNNIGLTISGTTLTLKRDGSGAADVTLPAGGGGESNTATWARTGNTDTFPDAKIAANIARDSEVTTATGNLGLVYTEATNDITLNRAGGGADTISLPEEVVVTLNPQAFPAGTAARRTYNLTVQSRANAFPTVVRAEVRIGGTILARGSWTAAETVHNLRFEINNTNYQNLADQVSGGAFREGLFIRVELRLYAAGDRLLYLNVFPVPVGGYELPQVDSNNNGQVLQVVSGRWASQALTIPRPTGVTRFEAAVGVSPATLPAGSHTLNILATDEGGSGTHVVLLSQLTGTARPFYFRTGQRAQQHVAMTLAYNSTTRVLTYAVTEGTAAIRVVGVR